MTRSISVTVGRIDTGVNRQKRRRLCVSIREDSQYAAEPEQIQQNQTPSQFLQQMKSKARRFRKIDTEQSKSQDETGVLKRVVGVDYGTHMTGLAFQIHGLWTAKALPAIKSSEYVYETAKEILKYGIKLKVSGFVVGLPPRDGGNIKHHWTDGRNARRCRSLAFTLAQMAKQYNMKVLVCDENYTTLNVRLEKNLSWRKMTKLEKRDVDSAAAIMILANYFRDPANAFEIKPSFDTRYMKKKYDEIGDVQSQQQLAT